MTLKSLAGWMIKLASGLLAVALLSGLAMPPAYAAGSPDTSAASTPSGPIDQALQNIYQREQT